MTNDELTLETDGVALQGWDRVSVTRSIERLPSSFSLGLLDYFPETNSRRRVRPGLAANA